MSFCVFKKTNDICNFSRGLKGLVRAPKTESFCNFIFILDIFRNMHLITMENYIFLWSF